MRSIHLAFPALPPAHDGIGDHTARLAGALAEHVGVTVLTTPAAAAGAVLSPGVRARPALRWRRRYVDASGLAEAVAAERPGALVLQYNPNSWGLQGINPLLPRAFRAARRAHPRLRLGLMVHEPFYPPTTLKRAVLSAAQRRQLRALVRAADVVFVSTEAWEAPLRGWARSGTPFVLLPSGSNVEEAGWTREAARAALGLGADTLVAGVFGTAHYSRLLPLVRVAADRLRAAQAARGADFLVLYVGPDGAAVRTALSGLPVRDLGRLPEEGVSQALTAMDLHLVPFFRGVSARRGSFTAGLQHGLPSVSTLGSQTDRFLAEADGAAFLLAPEDDAGTYAAHAVTLASDPVRRRAMAEAARKLYLDTFAWPLLAERVLASLSP